MGFGNVCLKVLTGIFGTTFIITGLALAAYGSLSAYSIFLLNSETVIKTYGTVIPSIVIGAFGIVLIIIVLFGCCGILQESTRCVETYSAFLLLLAFTQVAFGAYCVIYYGSDTHMANIDYQIDADIYRAVQNYRYDQRWMDQVQRWMKCCGRKDALSEYSVYPEEPNGNELPFTCCDKAIVTCRREDRYLDGCSPTVTAFTFGTNLIMGWISIVVGATEFVASLLGVCLSCLIWRNRSNSWR